MSNSLARALVFSLLALSAALILSVAIGPVTIPPRAVLAVLAARLSGSAL